VAFIFRIAQTANKSELSILSASESSRTLRPFISIKKNHKNSIILIGNFDGLHLGHQKLFRLAKRYKKKYSSNI